MKPSVFVLGLAWGSLFTCAAIKDWVIPRRLYAASMGALVLIGTGLVCFDL